MYVLCFDHCVCYNRQRVIYFVVNLDVLNIAFKSIESSVITGIGCEQQFDCNFTFS